MIGEQNGGRILRELRDQAGKCVQCGGPRSKWNLCSYCARKLEGKK